MVALLKVDDIDEQKFAAEVGRVNLNSELTGDVDSVQFVLSLAACT